MTQPRLIIGLSSGTNLDGVDAALVEARGVGLELRLQLVHLAHQAYPRDLQDLIRHVAAGNAPTRQIALVHRLLGEVFAVAVRVVADQARVGLQKVLCIGCPGHTVVHETDGRYPATLSLGMTAVLAERT